MASPYLLSRGLTLTKKWNFYFVRFLSTSNAQTKRFYPRRAIMYIPGSDKRKLQKIPSLGVDTVVIDFEDGVAVNQKVFYPATYSYFIMTQYI